MKRIFVIIFLGLAFAFGGWFVYARTTPRIVSEEVAMPSTMALASASVSSPRAVSATSAKTASMLLISKLRIEANVESVGLDKQGNMDVPKNAMNVGWYNLGVKPGQQGNVVMAGHFDTVTGAPAVFYRLTDLSVGDEIRVKDDKNDVFTYRVVDEQTYMSEAFPLQEVFGVTDKYRLNLITCSGQFDNAANNYSHRTVIYSELAR